MTISNIGDYLESKGCTKSGALVMEDSGLAKKTFTWTPSNPLLQENFSETFFARYGVRFNDRRSAIESETLSEAFNRLDEAFSITSVCGLPKGYTLTQQDIADLFYVLGPRGGLAMREIVMVEVDKVVRRDEDENKDENKKDEDKPIENKPIEPEPIKPIPIEPVTVTPTLILSPESLLTLENVFKWKPPFNAGRISAVRCLAKEIQAYLKEIGMETPQDAPSKPKSSSLKISGLDTFLIIGMIPQLATLYPEIQNELKNLGERGESLKVLIPKTLEAVQILQAIHKLATT